MISSSSSSEDPINGMDTGEVVESSGAKGAFVDEISSTAPSLPDDIQAAVQLINEAIVTKRVHPGQLISSFAHWLQKSTEEQESAQNESTLAPKAPDASRAASLGADSDTICCSSSESSGPASVEATVVELAGAQDPEPMEDVQEIIEDEEDLKLSGPVYVSKRTKPVPNILDMLASQKPEKVVVHHSATSFGVEMDSGVDLATRVKLNKRQRQKTEDPKPVEIKRNRKSSVVIQEQPTSSKSIPIREYSPEIDAYDDMPLAEPAMPLLDVESDNNDDNNDMDDMPALEICAQEEDDDDIQEIQVIEKDSAPKTANNDTFGFPDDFCIDDVLKSFGTIPAGKYVTDTAKTASKPLIRSLLVDPNLEEEEDVSNRPSTSGARPQKSYKGIIYPYNLQKQHNRNGNPRPTVSPALLQTPLQRTRFPLQTSLCKPSPSSSTVAPHLQKMLQNRTTAPYLMPVKTLQMGVPRAQMPTPKFFTKKSQALAHMKLTGSSAPGAPLAQRIFKPTPANRSKRSSAKQVAYKEEASDSEEEPTPSEAPTSQTVSSLVQWKSGTPSIEEILKNIKNPQAMTEDQYVPYCDAYVTRVFILAKYKEQVKAGRQFGAEVIQAIKRETRGLEEKNCFSVAMDPDSMPKCTAHDLREIHGFISGAVIPGCVSRSFCLYDARKDLKVIDPPMMINFTGNVYIDRKKQTGEKITEMVKKYGRSSISEPLNIENRKLLVPVQKAKSDSLSDRERRAMFSKEEREKYGSYLPVPIFEPKSMSEFDGLQEAIERASICLVRGVDKLTGIDASKFEVSEMSKVNENFLMKGPRIMGQPTSSNYQRIPTESLTGEWNDWSCAHFQQDILLSEFAEYYEKISKLTDQAVNDIDKEPQSIKKVIEKLRKDLYLANIQRAKEDKGVKDAISIAFGSNIDITQEKLRNGAQKFEEQLENIKKLPFFLHPDSNGTLLDFCGLKMPGINTAQVYIKAPVVRTTAHLENGCLGSINLNLGPGTSIWYSVPVEFAGRFQELVRAKLQLGDGDCEFFTYGYWPIEEECLAEGLPLQKFIQESGDMVFVGPGTYHWVQSNEFTTQVSWNIGSFSYRQLAWLAISHDNYLANNFAPVVPLETLIWNLVIEKDAPKVTNDAMIKLVKTMLMRSLANCVSQEIFVQSKELQVKMVDPKKDSIEPVERCDAPECGNHTFNMFLKKKAGDEEEVYCLKCADRENILEDPDYTIFMRYTIKELEDFYDSFKY